MTPKVDIFQFEVSEDRKLNAIEKTGNKAYQNKRKIDYIRGNEKGLQVLLVAFFTGCFHPANHPKIIHS